MKRPIEFAQIVLEDLGTWCSTSTTLDCKTVKRRFEHEGWSFLTITLPNFGKDLEKGLDQGFVSDDLFAGFARTGGFPRFLGGFLRLVFESGSGRLLSNPDITAIWAIRQFTLMFAKINLPCSDARERAAMRGYIECEMEVRRADASITLQQWKAFDRIATLLWADALSSLDLAVFRGEIIPKHGPGKTADRLVGNDKWVPSEWTWRLEEMFPSWEHLVSGRREHDFLALDAVRLHEPGTERPVRVVSVPKTLKTPRIIAIEPTCMQYMQQGLLEAFGSTLRQVDTCWGFVGWSSQMPNQYLAYKGSEDGTLATLDLKEASDRVSNQHVRRLLHNYPSLAQGVDGSRSRKADVPGHGVIRLAKFASMGSALTFPLESMVFTTIIFLGIESALNRPLTRKDITSFLGQVRVYGDDIVVPVEYVHTVMAFLEAFGLKVNASKSFWTGKFRESCGGDFYDGVDVSVVRVRSLFPSSRQSASEIVSTFAARNHLYKAGLWKAASYIDSMFTGMGIPVPRVDEQSSVLGRNSFLGPDLSGKLDSETHRPLVKGMIVSSSPPASPLEGQAALLKCLTLAELSNRDRTLFDDSSDINLWDLPSTGVSHLEYSGRPRAVYTKLGWGSST